VLGLSLEKEDKEESMTILDLNDGESFKVKRVSVGREIGKRLADMGFVRGIEGRVVRSALLGDPLQIKICHYDVSLRRSEAKGIEVERFTPVSGHQSVTK
jgi:Fe2+ transport system protein FeoA